MAANPGVPTSKPVIWQGPLPIIEAALHCNVPKLHYMAIPMHCIALQYTFTALHFTALHCTSIHFTVLEC